MGGTFICGKFIFLKVFLEGGIRKLFEDKIKIIACFDHFVTLRDKLNIKPFQKIGCVNRKLH